MLQQFYPQPPSHPFPFELNKDMHFAAAHFIPDERAGKCAFTHGHTYFVNLTIAGEQLDEMGMLVNFSDLKKIVHDKYDHQLLNDFPEYKKRAPSTEEVSRQIYQLIETHLVNLPNKPKCLQVIVRETPTSYCIYRPKRDEKV